MNNNIVTPSLTQLSARLDTLAKKLEMLQVSIDSIAQEKSFMENKISDAQNRIQKILNKLPQTPDTRQLNLLDNSTTVEAKDE